MSDDLIRPKLPGGRPLVAHVASALRTLSELEVYVASQRDVKPISPGLDVTLSGLSRLRVDLELTHQCVAMLAPAMASALAAVEAQTAETKRLAGEVAGLRDLLARFEH